MTIYGTIYTLKLDFISFLTYMKIFAEVMMKREYLVREENVKTGKN